MKKILQFKYLPFWLMTIGLFMGLILPVLIMDGMFMDGILYACISNNLAHGIGTPWFLQFSELGFASNPSFHEHPPLIFWIQAGFFKLLGSSLYVERFYSFLTAVITLLLLVRTWKMINREDAPVAKLGWLPVIFWILVPVVFWSYQNNTQENTMGVFTLAAIIFVLKAVHLTEKSILNLMLAGLMIFCASFSKGVPGFFPLAAVFLHWIVFRKFGFLKMVLYSGILLLVPALIYGLILLIPAARESLDIYVNQRLLVRINDVHTRDSHFYIVSRIFWELLPGMILVLITLLIYRLRKVDLGLKKEHYKMILFFGLLGISASVPVALTLVQKTFYISPSFPFFAISLALLVAPGMANPITKIDTAKIGFKIASGLGVLIIAAVIVVTVMQDGKYSRNKDVLHDAYLIEKVIPHNSIINVPEKVWVEWDMRCYLIRYFYITMDPNLQSKREFYLTDQKLNETPDSTYVLVDLPTKKYDLYQQRSR